MGSYFDLDDILAEEEPVGVQFRVAAAGVGILDPSAEENQVEVGSKVELPFWLAQELWYSQAVSLKLPNFYNERIRKEVKADPGCVDLRSRCPYFYELGCKLVPLAQDATLGSFLMFSLRGRYRDLLCKSHTAAGTVTPKFLARLTREETRRKHNFALYITPEFSSFFFSTVFEAGAESMKAFRKWRLEGTRLEKAPVLGKKRRPTSDTPENT
ncbi:DNA replication complex GINS protein PSF3 isoform X1 [Selaginella moellendorffii]|uniref:DNA replication complex GINS protein PSF3 isoform X1 n=1 Tax=Selaginella moellendorffii TaxID=88036 RepID=UPI000D1C62FB|nr:DNA replication complex GINS protein PSF3 isoform X1 [Selaginella moellendorffii]|eukprot:XP_024525005.1 DNA replication complex GINS protein PSF3 isoform X1 [Selaginella moellendorffii]